MRRILLLEVDAHRKELYGLPDVAANQLINLAHRQRNRHK